MERHIYQIVPFNIVCQHYNNTINTSDIKEFLSGGITMYETSYITKISHVNNKAHYFHAALLCLFVSFYFPCCLVSDD